MGLGGSLLFKAAALAAVSASSLPGIPLCPGIHRRFVGPGRALKEGSQMVGHWRPTFNCLEKRLAVGANCERVLRVVSGGPIHRNLHCSRFFRER